MSTYVFDSEVYRNYYLLAFLNVDTNETLTFEYPLEINKIRRLLARNKTIGFNSINYDIPILNAALSGRSESELKNMSDRIIKNGIKWWIIYRNYPDIRESKFKQHIDLIEVAPGKASLKMYGGRLNTKRMQSLPIHFDAILTDEEKTLIKEYCVNDLQQTKELYQALSKQLKLREDISKQLKTDVMSKSDAQIAESVFKSKIPNVKKPNFDDNPDELWQFHYKVPEFISFKTDGMKEVLQNIIDAVFTVQSTGKCPIPKEITKIELFGKVYKMGVGGLHSTEKSISHVTNSEHFLADHDVASYYPSIILNQGLYPQGTGKAFLKVYKDIYNTRLKAKATGDKVTANTLKITLNGSFGKLGSKYSFLFAPELLIQTTITGQLSLLMLIEDFELAGIPVVSANTDGVVVKCPWKLEHVMYDVILDWEDRTAFDTEENRYNALYSRDVNNYIALKDGKAKKKGAYADPSLMKNSANIICVEAVTKFLSEGIDLETTIKSCRDVTKFITIRTVKGGAIDSEGKELGAAIRWYYSTEINGCIKYCVNGNKVPKTDGARELQELPEALPKDIDYYWYIKESQSILKDIGYVRVGD